MTARSRADGALARWGPWLVNPRFDLGIFLLPAVVALALVPVGRLFRGELPLPMWVIAVLAIDVAHVYATLFVTYLDPEARARHRGWLVGAPLAAFAVGLFAIAVSTAWFWTLLAYVAVFHFVRQQYGWVALYQRKETDSAGWERALDRGAIYVATLYPVLWWHANLPRQYHWFVPGDFVAGLVPGWVLAAGGGLYAALLGGFAAVQIGRKLRGRRVSLGKSVVVGTTAACWGVGIIATNTDWAFTVTNVILHGVPYTAFVWSRAFARRSPSGSDGSPAAAPALGLSAFAFVLVGFAYVEELAWDRLVWHEAALVFPLPEVVLPDAWGRVAVALLAVPQFAHYILDARIWRRTSSRSSGLSRG